MIRVLILTVSDSCAQGRREDAGGPAVAETLPRDRFEVRARKVVPDDRETIAAELAQGADRGDVDLVLTTGGTGLGPRDVTPEATAAVCDRMAPGFGEVMRMEGLQRTPNAMLSRAVAGIRKATLIINLPGSPRGARESLEAILPILPHAIGMLHGGGH